MVTNNNSVLSQFSRKQTQFFWVEQEWSLETFFQSNWPPLFINFPQISLNWIFLIGLDGFHARLASLCHWPTAALLSFQRFLVTTPVINTHYMFQVFVSLYLPFHLHSSFFSWFPLQTSVQPLTLLLSFIFSFFSSPLAFLLSGMKLSSFLLCGLNSSSCSSAWDQLCESVWWRHVGETGAGLACSGHTVAPGRGAHGNSSTAEE